MPPLLLFRVVGPLVRVYEHPDFRARVISMYEAGTLLTGRLAGSTIPGDIARHGKPWLHVCTDTRNRIFEGYVWTGTLLAVTSPYSWEEPGERPV